VNSGQFRILHGDSIGVAVFVVLDFESCGLRQFGQGCERFVHHRVEILVDNLDALECSRGTTRDSSRPLSKRDSPLWGTDSGDCSASSCLKIAKPFGKTSLQAHPLGSTPLRLPRHTYAPGVRGVRLISESPKELLAGCLR